MALNTRWPFFFDERLTRDEFFRPFFAGLPDRRSAGVFPPINLFDDGNAFYVRAEIPGVSKDSLEVTAKGDQLTIRGERVVKPASPEASYHRRECDGGQFRRTVTLPQAVDAEKIDATYRNGVLEVVLPRVPELKPRRIAVN